MSAARTVWARLVSFGFRLLYNELAWLYDPVSWLVSFGLWRRWQETALHFLPPPAPAGNAPPRVLEVGVGPGHLLARLSTAGYQACGIDLSRAMLRQARRNLRDSYPQGHHPSLYRARAQALPFAAATFDAVLLTFPAPFVYDPAWIQGLVRILRPGGRVIVVETATPATTEPGLATRALEGLYTITGQRGPGPDLAALLSEAGLAARREGIPVDSTIANLVVATRRTEE